MGQKTTMGIGLILPGVPDAQDACLARLKTLLENKPGVESTHLKDDDAGDESSSICVHYDPNVISLSEVRAYIKRAGVELSQRYGHLLVAASPMHAREARSFEQAVQALPGVIEAGMSPAGVLRIEFDRDATDDARLQTLINEVIPRTKSEHLADSPSAADGEHSHDHNGLFGEQTELIVTCISGALLVAGWLAGLFVAASWVSISFYIGAFITAGFFTVREAVGNIIHGRFEIDFLMLVAAGGAAVLGKWPEGALLLFLFSLGHALEHYAMGRARRAIEALAELAPQTAIVRRNGTIQELPVEQLVVGDIAIIKPNERVPADGFVTKGESSVNQAPITGESVPVDKRPVPDADSVASSSAQLSSEHRVFAGTINGSGALEVQVTKASTDSTLARVIEMVNEAETQKSPTQRFTDQFERYFVPAVIALAVVLLFAWVVVDEPFRDSFYRSMAVLVAASPCALAIATPSAVLSGVARAARGGVLVKGGGPLENLGTITAIAFDKTGTLTEGKPRLIDVVAADGQSEEQLLRTAVAVESLSDHPLAAAVVEEGRRRLGNAKVGHATDLKSITGRGVQAVVDGTMVHIGKHDLFSEIDGEKLPSGLRSKIAELERNGRTTMVVRSGSSYLGVLGLMDTPRAKAQQTIARLRELGVKRLIMLSGDNQQVADAVSKAVGIEEAWGDLMPDGKVDAIKKLRANGGVAMIGDGVNDAPAMASASVGVAMGAAGSDVALETADVALMADDLAHLPFAVGLSRKTSRVIRQNLWFSLGVVALLLPATIFGLPMGAAVVFHEGSTLLVVLNALRLLAYAE
ncbi:putative cadmium-transporting ATPase [Caulifigura coniformis]|uniref:P-type Zn(2+) transporter n=1 Tax=Caulifigura coniformis TaxID=2527983 RepID=A0A517SLN0_9PLAN|nr:heavy metal translocating P-type ATPase [Caulifigura coniformis]QDT57032.1 putative cadmium-transporting ATPase [Caulifigura coniformis]